VARKSPDDEAYQFLAAPGARLDVELAKNSADQSELRLLGNRAGLLSFANVLLWLSANDFRREVLSIAELPFVHLAGSLSFCMRMIGGHPSEGYGALCRLDRGFEYEWHLSDAQLQRAALLIHHLACLPAHEYDRVELAAGSAASMEVRMTDAAAWIAQGHA
jgi:hypothetical protein